ncbi:hypothetical protein [Citricoccus alkalitolerans]|uniref:Aminoglycoside phosphotransferase domain-containing protein n=1 Tax=Citricoccus alkalitolerans TaxID=246603 RepID=A0ABV8XTX6_9MICC
MRSPDLTTPLVDLAATHGLDLDPSTLSINEMGLDFRVALATTASCSATSPNGSAGERWVLRIPRRPDALRRAEVESRVLDLVGPRLSVAVPQWGVQATDLIAYPALPGEPGLTLDPDGAPVWHLDITPSGMRDPSGRSWPNCMRSIPPKPPRPASRSTTRMR